MKDMKKPLGVAYGIKRRNSKMMSSGGMVNEKMDPGYEPDDVDSMVDAMMKKQKMAMGGEVESMEPGMEDMGVDDMFAMDPMKEPSWSEGNEIGNEEEEKARMKARMRAIMGRS